MSNLSAKDVVGIKKIIAVIGCCMSAVLIFFAFSLPVRAEIIGTVTASSVNIRSGAGISFEKIGVAEKSQVFKIVNEDQGWYQVRYDNNVKAWISGDYLKITNDGTVPATVSTVEAVNIRSGSGTTYSKLATVAVGTVLNVSGESGYWYKVTYNSQVGYIAKWLVEIQTTESSESSSSGSSSSGSSSSGSSSTLSPASAMVDTSVLNLRAAPSDTSDILAKYYQGTQLLVYAVSGTWYKVKTADGCEGWMAAEYISFDNIKNSVHSVAEPTVPVFAGSTVQGEIDISYTSVGYGYQLELRGDNYISYNVSKERNRITLSTDMQISGDMPSGNGLIFEVEGSLDNILNISCNDELYYGITSSADGRILTIEVGQSPLVGRLIYLDPGHASLSKYGEPDSGAISASGLQEKDVVMVIAQKAQEMLEELGATVILSRGDTTDLTLGARAYPANIAGADVLVSIHCNASTNTATCGTSVWMYAPVNDLAYDREKVLLLANSLQTSLISSAGRYDYGIHESNFAVLRAAAMPAVLVETAFLSNPTEAALLAEDSFRQLLAEGIVDGLTDYFMAY